MIATILFITGDDNYKDRVLDNRLNSETDVIWYGQTNQKSTDKYVLNREEIHIWYRKKQKDKFKYLGKVKEKKVLKERDNDQNLVVDMKIEKENLKINAETEAEVYDYEANNRASCTKNKMNCFKLLGMEPWGNWCSGIMIGNYE